MDQRYSRSLVQGDPDTLIDVSRVVGLGRRQAPRHDTAVHGPVFFVFYRD